MKKIIITESQLDMIKNNQHYVENNNVEVFKTEIKSFLYNIITNQKEKISDYWGINGISKSDLFRMLKKYKIVEENVNGEILVPKKNFDRKINRLFCEIFENDTPDMVMKEDDGGTSCSSVGGSYEMPLFSVQRRKINNN
jgi:hypothetical protein